MKNKNFTYLVLIMTGMLYPVFSHAQNISQEPKPKVAVAARALENQIILRWSPTTPVAWQYGNQYGYIVRRTTILRDGKLLETPEVSYVSPSPIKPLAYKEWEPLVKSNKYAAITAQALYGETFKLAENYKGDVMQVVNKAQELENRFTFALFSAQISQEVAEASGLKFIDKNVKANERYNYNVYIPVPKSIYSVDTGFVYSSVQDYRPLPKPEELGAEFSDSSATLVWSCKHDFDIFIAYKIERSEEGKTFVPTSDEPFINTFQDINKIPEIVTKVELLPKKGTTYHFRVRGITSFGEISEPSESVSGTATFTALKMPSVSLTKVIDNKSVQIEWEFPQELNKEIAGFYVERAEKEDGIYKSLTAKELVPESRSFIDHKPDPANYYRMVVVTKAGKKAISFPHLVQLKDNTPPAIPEIISAKADTSGIVILTWKNNKEKDLFGYKIYRANYEYEEYSQITTGFVKDSIYYDTIEVNSLTKNVYYKIVALDRHYNPSGFSKPFVMKRPDIIPPVPPVFKEAHSSEKGVSLTWNNTSSSDVVKYQLLRRDANREGFWVVLKEFRQADSITTYVDEEADKSILYEYSMIAFDDSGLESEMAQPVTMKKLDKGIREEVKSVRAEADRINKRILVAWNYSEPGIEKVQIYRAKEGESLTLYKTIQGAAEQFIDKSLQVNTIYKYRIKVLFKNGAQSPFSKEIIVNY
ncbi:MAG: hypothetical protein K2X86_06525 [Cytophagaceae bacterium]|nr:hypothetical protein [Cytophagaceae bacterium]